MYLDFLVKVPTVKGKITRRKKSNVVYIEYEYDRVYDPSRKYTFPKRVTIGKLSDTDPELIEYSRAVTPQIRQAGNRLSGLAETAYASLLA